jgi:hypothetical protein
MDNLLDDNTEDNIRPPDEVRVEQLLEDTRSEYDKQIDEAINLSMLDIIEKQNIALKIEGNISDSELKTLQQEPREPNATTPVFLGPIRLYSFHKADR